MHGDINIFDAQVHAWAQGDSTGHHRRTPITGQVLLAEMDEAGVDRALLVPPLWDPAGNRYSLELAREHPGRFVVMGVLRPGEAPSTIADWPEVAGMKGLRVLLNAPERLAPFLAGELDSLWGLAEDLGLTTALLVPGQLQHVRGIAKRHPRLKIIVDHLGVPRGASGPSAFDHLPALLELASLPNVAVKAAGVGDYALDPYPFASLDAALRRIHSAFGAERIVWASELSRLHHPYADCVKHFAEALTWLSPTERAQILGGNLSRLLGWPG